MTRPVRSTRPLSLPRVVVGLDGSPSSAAALAWAIGYARAAAAEIVAVHAFALPPDHVGHAIGQATPFPYDKAVRGRTQAALEHRWCAPLSTAGVAWRTVFRDGCPASVLLEVAEREDAELIVTGRRGLSALGEFVLGSVSHELMHRSRRPVALIPRPERPVRPAPPPEPASARAGSEGG